MLCQRIIRPQTYFASGIRSTTRYVSSQTNNGSVSKTNIKLSNLPISANLSSLKESLKDLNLRRIELEPGCVLHFSNEAEAENCKAKLSNIDTYASLDTRISTTMLPSLLIKNCPSNLHPDAFIKDLKGLNQANYHYYSAKEALLVANNAHDVLEINKALASLKSDNIINYIEVSKKNV